MRFILLSLLLLVSISLSYAEIFEIIESSADEVVVRFSLPQWELAEIERGGEHWQEIISNGSSVNAVAGKPEIPYYTGMVGIPPDGDIEVSILEDIPESESNICIVPAWKQVIKDGEPEIEYYCDQRLYGQHASYPSRAVEKGYTAMSGDRRYYSFRVNPFQFQPENRILVVHNELTIRIQINGSKERFRGIAAGSIFDKAQDLLLNDEQSRSWRLARDQSGSYPVRRSNLVDSYRLVIDKEGIYKVSYEYIMGVLEDLEYETEIDWDNINPRYLELSDKSGTVPIYFSGDADGSFDAGDYFEFYADINHGETTWFDDYTSENVLYLRLEDHLGARMMIENGGLVESNPDNFELPESFEQTLHIEKQIEINHLGAQTQYQGMDYFREDIWWWGVISAPDLKVFEFELEYPHTSNIRKASATVCLFGLTYDGENISGLNDINKHRAVVRINSALVDDIGSNGEWLGQREQIFENLPTSSNNTPILNTDLYHGTNQLSISVPNLVYTNEQVLLDYLELTYWREYKTDTDKIKFHKPIQKPIGSPEPYGLYQFNLEGFSTDNVSIYKIGSSVVSNYSITSLSEEGGAPYMISFQDSVLSDETEYYAVAESSKLEPKSMEPDYPSNLQLSSNGAEYVIITVAEFVENAVLLEEYWENRVPGLNVEIVRLQDIFDEFNSGIRSAESIKEFLSYAYNNWEPRPEYCLFLGEGLIDERDNSSYRWANKIPTKLEWLLSRGATASDNWFGCIVGDDNVSDISIARLNITQPSQIETILNKTTSYMDSPAYDDMWHSSITLATGGKASEGNVFSLQSERIRNNTIDPEYRINRVYCNVQDMPAEYAGNTTTLINSINDGSLFVQFMGHGASNQWDDYDLFDIYDVANLNNSNYFIASSMSCYGSAFFEGAGVSCIGEALTLDSQGAIAQIGFTGFGFLNTDEDYSKALLGALMHPEIRTIGEIIDYTKTVFYASVGNSYEGHSLLQSSALLGDPRVEVPLPETGADIELNKYNFAKGDSITMTANTGDEIIEGRFYLYDENDAPVPVNEFYPFTYQAVHGKITRQAVIPGSDILPQSTYNRYLKFSGHSAAGEITGKTSYFIGLPGAYNIEWQPLHPGPEEDIDILADFYDEDGVDSVSCHIKIYRDIDDPFNDYGSYYSHYYQPMVWDTELEKYHLSSVITGLPYDYSLRFNFIITDSLGNVTESTHLPNENYIRVQGVKFKLTDFGIIEADNSSAVEVSVFNNGNISSEECSLKLYLDNSQALLDSIRIEPLGVGEQRWEIMTLPPVSGDHYFMVKIDEEQESSGYASLVTGHYELQLFEAGVEAVSITSIDGNVECEFPAGLLAEPAVFSLVKIDGLEAINQPDIEGLELVNGESSPAYELICYNSELLSDSLGSFPGNGQVEIKFNYDLGERGSRRDRDESRYSVYRWNEKYQKWVFMTIGADPAAGTVNYLSERTGIYGVWDNQDLEVPSIDVNVEGQEFTYGGYVSENGLISFLLSDKNGVDIVENEMSFLIDGAIVNAEDYSINSAQGMLTSVPVKYQMNEMSEGIHYLQMSCRDFNGNSFERELSFEVKAEFELINVANYPNPVKSLTIDPINTGRTRFTYVLTDDAETVKIKIYTVSGRLVKTFENLSASIGYHEYPQSNIGWDCRDEKGDYLANGVYFYKVIAHKNGKKIEKTQKMAILK